VKKLQAVSKDCQEKARLKKADQKGKQLDRGKEQTKEISSNQKYWMQRYWTRRSRLLTAARKQQRLLAQQKKMQATSSVSMLDLRLLFRKAEHCAAKASSKLQSLHNCLCNKLNIYLDKLPTDRTPEETEITAAFWRCADTHVSK